ncbi:hypothetical protein JCGZ_18919 [Jatropha curcas]|uniref:Uncharacterized protein n=1 Tax=Jatropha curcas TaxID=180498 RepID=A0A067K7P9_JATCU|nr:hypothetical protein JCGZ_18919 [Jatropha curcas]
MAPQLDRLVKIGDEGFALIEECYGRNNPTGRSGSGRALSSQGHEYHHHRQQPLVYHGPQISTVRMPVAVSNEIAQHYGGGSTGKKPVMITSDQAAEYYGGLAIMEYGLRNRSGRT